MADEPDDLVLRLLREIREDQTDMRHRMGKLERTVTDATELMTQALGMAAFANVRTDRFDDRVAEVEDRMTALETRVRELRR